VNYPRYFKGCDKGYTLYHLLALLGAHHTPHVSRIRVKIHTPKNKLIRSVNARNYTELKNFLDKNAVNICFLDRWYKTD
jgi:hypothetical protein